MKDYKLKRRNLRASHTLGWSWCDTSFFFWTFFIPVCYMKGGKDEEKKEEPYYIGFEEDARMWGLQTSAGEKI